MKKFLLYPSIGIFLCVLISCQSMGKKKEEPFTVDWESPKYQIGEIEVQMDPIMSIGKLKKHSITVLYAPNDDAIILRFRKELVTYHQCWSRSGRQLFIDALNKYNEDYDARALKEKDKNSIKKYGTDQGFLIWQMFKYTTRANGTMNVRLGYTFKEKSPYFVVNQLKAEYTDKITRDRNATSAIMNYYFTRAQAADLAALFSPEYIDGLNIKGSLPRYIEKDDYQEFEE